MKQWLQTEWDYASWSESTMESAIMGTVEECVEQLEPHLATGIDRIIFVPYRYENEQVEAVAKEIIPRLRRRRGEPHLARFWQELSAAAGTCCAACDPGALPARPVSACQVQAAHLSSTVMVLLTLAQPPSPRPGGASPQRRTSQLTGDAS